MSKKLKAVVGIVAAGSLILSLGVGVFASTNGTKGREFSSVLNSDSVITELSDQSTMGTAKGFREGNKMGRGHERMNGIGGKGISIDVDKFVTAGLIDQETATSITDFITAKEAEREAERETVQAMTQEERQAYFAENASKVRVDLFDELVTEGILTQTKADSIHDYIQDERLKEKEANLISALEPFVTDSTITQAQADAIISDMKEQETAREAERELVNAMNDTERQVYFAEHVKELPFANLVADGTLTQAQADILEDLLRHGRHSNH